MTVRCRRPFIWVALILTTPVALAVNPECARYDAPPLYDSVGPRDRINALEHIGCLGGDRDDNALTRAVTAILSAAGSDQAAGVSAGERRQVTLQALDQIARSATAHREYSATESGMGIQERLLRLGSALKEAQLAVLSGRGEEGLQRPAYWKYNPNNGEVCNSDEPTQCIQIALFVGFIDTACPALPPSPGCQTVYTAAQDILRYVRLTERSLSYYGRPIIDAHYADAQRRDRQWDAYFDDALFQYPWELAANGVYLKRHDPRPRDGHGNKLGFLPPPTSQWILLHPNVGLEYVKAAPDGQQFKPVVYVELVGHNRWRWRESGEMKSGLGWSIMTSYADRAGVDDLRYGLMLHYRNRFDLGITYSDKEAGVILSMDLAQALSSISQEARSRLRFLGE